MKRGLEVQSRKTEGEKQMVGHTTGGERSCGIEDCNGRAIGVRWPDGKLTFPCTAGMAGSEEEGWFAIT